MGSRCAKKGWREVSSHLVRVTICQAWYMLPFALFHLFFFTITCELDIFSVDSDKNDLPKLQLCQR